MKADSFKIAKVFSGGGDIHYVLPHFQREYSWGEAEWKTLLDDATAIYDEYDPDREPEHFLGALVVINDGTRNGVIPALKLVDGQQRLTTISLLFCALRDLLSDSNPSLSNKIQKMLVNRDEEGELYFKVLPTLKYGDREAYTRLVGSDSENFNTSDSNIPKAYNYFYEKLKNKLSSQALKAEQFFVVLSNCFQVVLMDLSQDESPYKIFESLNAKGKQLTQADLVRNYIAMTLPAKYQESLFKEQWEKIESLLQEKRTVGKSRVGELTGFIRHYLAIESRSFCSEKHIYYRFRDRIEKNFKEPNLFIGELKNISQFAEYYDKLLRPEREADPKIQEALCRLNILDIQMAYPFLMTAYDAWKSQKISHDDFLGLLKVLENYMVRRFICDEPNSTITTVFAYLWNNIQTEIATSELSFVDSLKKVLVTKSYPPDRNIRSSVKKVKLYQEGSTQKNKKLIFILEEINFYLSRGTGGFTALDRDDQPSIEHILPQKPVEDWKIELGEENLNRIYQDYLHTLGNLTLVTSSWNKKLSNSPFLTKKEILENHGLKINSDYFKQEIHTWNDNAILERANFLVEKFLEIWSAFGEAPPLETKLYDKPKSITILEETIDIPKKTWREVLILTTEWVLKNRPDSFENARNMMSGTFCDSDRIEMKKSPRSWHKLSNGVWLDMRGSAKAHIRFCNRLLKAVGIQETDWSVNREEDKLTDSQNLNV